MDPVNVATTATTAAEQLEELATKLGVSAEGLEELGAALLYADQQRERHNKRTAVYTNRAARRARARAEKRNA